MATKQIWVWEFRANLDDYPNEDWLIQKLHKYAKKFVFQLEKGEESGYMHWQGRMSLWKQKRKSELMKLMKGSDFPVPNYLEPTTTEEHKKEAFYVMKEDTRVRGPWTEKDLPAYVPRQYRNLVLWPWQKKVIDSKDKFDCRTVDCIGS